LNENIDELINYKLTPHTLNGPEGYTNKFNDIINNLQQIGQTFEPKILKSIYLGNIKDKTYENIKDQASNDAKITREDVQSSLLRKYLGLVGERRKGAPSYAQKRFVNSMYTDPYHDQFYPTEDILDDCNMGYDEEQIFLPQDLSSSRDIYAMTGRGPPPKPPSAFPMIPKHLYDELPDEGKTIMRQQHAYYIQKYGKGNQTKPQHCPQPQLPKP
jgi:hypothetical protein